MKNTGDLLLLVVDTEQCEKLCIARKTLEHGVL